MIGPVVVLGRAEQVLRVGECGHPFAVGVQAGVPAHMVHVQVGAHHMGDRLGREASGGHVVEERTLLAVPQRVGAFLVVADAGVHRDAMFACRDHAGMDALQQVAVVADEVRAQPRRSLSTGQHAALADAVVEEARRGRRGGLRDRRDGHVADLPALRLGTLAAGVCLAGLALSGGVHGWRPT